MPRVETGRQAIGVSALADDERSRGLEIGWLVTLVTAAGAIGVSWLSGAMALNVPLALGSLGGLALVCLALDLALARVQDAYGLNAGVELGHAAKVLGLAALWHLAGGVGNVTFLPVFLLPILTAALLLMRRQALLIAALTAGAVNLIALWESPGLQQYVLRLGLPVERLISHLPPHGPGAAAPFPGFAAGPELQFAALVTFTTLIAAAAGLSVVLGTQTIGLFRRFLTASFAQGESGSLMRSAIREDPWPTVLVYADTAQIVEASRGFVNQMLLRREQLTGTTLFDCVAFMCPEAVRALLARPSGELKLAEYFVGTEYRVATVRSHRFQVAGVDFASIVLAEKNELSYLWEASDALDHPLLVVRNGTDIVYFNAAARRQCDELHFGMPASRFLQPVRSQGWADGDVVRASDGQAMRIRRYDLPRNAAGESVALLGLFPAEVQEGIRMGRARSSSGPSSGGRPHPGFATAIALLAMLGTGTSLMAQTNPAPARAVSSDTLFVNAERTDIAAGPQGRAGSIEWVHAAGAGGVNAGFVSARIGDTSWTYGRAGSMRRLSPRTTVHGQADLGAGRELRRGFLYLAAQGTIAHEVVDDRLFVELEDRYIDVDTTSGNIVKLGVTALPVRPLSVAVAMHASTAGNVEARSASLRIESRVGGLTVSAGMSAGRSQPVLLGLSTNRAAAQTLRETFAGATLPIKRLRVTVMADALELGETRRRSLSMTWMLPF